MKVDYLKQAWLVLTLALVFGAALAGVHVGLSDRIATNKLNETFQQIPYLVGLLEGDVERIGIAEAAPADGDAVYEMQRADGTFLGSFRERRTDDGKVAYEVFDEAFTTNSHAVGWVIKGAGQGFADKIEVLIGLGEDSDTGELKLKGLFVLDQKETPGLGDNIRSGDFRRRFVGKTAAGSLEVVKAGKGGQATDNEVEGWSGATISSRAVGDIVNAAVTDFQTHPMIQALLSPDQPVAQDD